MYLERLQLRGLGPFDDVELSFVDAQGEARPLTVLHGDGGTGKSTVLQAIDCTRPGRTVKGALYRTAGAEALVASAWQVGSEDPNRPHALWCATPGKDFEGPDGGDAGLRRREASVFEKQAQGPLGFLVLEFSEHRCFPRASLSLVDLKRQMLRHEIRQPPYNDRARHELTRRCKQVLAYAELSSALLGDARLVGEAQSVQLDARRLKEALESCLETVLALVGHRYAGIDPLSFEPLFETPDGRLCHLDEVAKQTRQLVAFVSMSAHLLWVRSGGQDPRQGEGVILIDEIELNLQPRVAACVLDALHEALPGAQWIATTSSPVVAASVAASSLLTLRRLPGRPCVELYTHELARTH